MKNKYAFSSARKNPYTNSVKQQITIHRILISF